eukprot:m.88443 g.88443  ORF g.88443 m.88443 type:complete len:72 (+) comp14539_c0_seq11:243-458(+)
MHGTHFNLFFALSIANNNSDSWSPPCSGLGATSKKRLVRNSGKQIVHNQLCHGSPRLYCCAATMGCKYNIL